MTQIEVFQFPATAQQVRTVVRDGEPWFVAKDACDVIGVSKYRDAVAQLDEDERVSTAVDTLGGRQTMALVNEAGLYSLMLISRSPKVKPFRRWVAHDVLPAIRKTGTFSIAVPRSLPEALRAYAAEVESHEVTRAELAAAEPKAEAWEALASLDGDYCARDAAFILNRDPNISTGQNRLIKKLREFEMTDARGVPYSRHANHLNLLPTSYENRKTGVREPTTQIRITVEGVRYLHKRMGGIHQPAFASLVRQVTS